MSLCDLFLCHTRIEKKMLLSSFFIVLLLLYSSTAQQCSTRDVSICGRQVEVELATPVRKKLQKKCAKWCNRLSQRVKEVTQAKKRRNVK